MTTSGRLYTTRGRVAVSKSVVFLISEVKRAVSDFSQATGKAALTLILCPTEHGMLDIDARERLQSETGLTVIESLEVTSRDQFVLR